MEETVFERDNEGEIYPTIENFYKFCGQGRLMAVKCERCGRLFVPPRVLCSNCYSSDFKWLQLSGRGKLQTYSTVHIAPKAFSPEAPYVVGIVRLEEGVNLPGRVILDKGQETKVGMDLVVDFENPQTVGWPRWPRYLFRPAKGNPA
ncbi:MAG: Zn-ribbon domain-containing OB-fold protein [Candidatus Bathyarchaeia archaeon]